MTLELQELDSVPGQVVAESFQVLARFADLTEAAGRTVYSGYADISFDPGLLPVDGDEHAGEGELAGVAERRFPAEVPLPAPVFAASGRIPGVAGRRCRQDLRGRIVGLSGADSGRVAVVGPVPGRGWLGGAHPEGEREPMRLFGERPDASAEIVDGLRSASPGTDCARVAADRVFAELGTGRDGTALRWAGRQEPLEDWLTLLAESVPCPVRQSSFFAACPTR